MKLEDRIIKASIATGITDIAFGALAFISGFGDWYYKHLHNFGIFGLSMLAYGLWHIYFKYRDEK